MKVIILFCSVFFLSNAFAQIDDDGFGGGFGSTTDTFGQDESYFEFGPNYALTQRNNFF